MTGDKFKAILKHWKDDRCFIIVEETEIKIKIGVSYNIYVEVERYYFNGSAKPPIKITAMQGSEYNINEIKVLEKI